MRDRAKSAEGLTVRAVAGTYVVLLGFDIAPEKRKGLLGFAVRRVNHDPPPDEKPEIWLSNRLHPPGATEKPGIDESGTDVAPIQRFRWGDYTVHPDREYTYAVSAMYGELGKLEKGDSVDVKVRTENPRDVGGKSGLHQVHFNRSAASSQAYVKKFGDKEPDDPSLHGAALQWLSRGLEESLIDFINQAKDPTWSLHLCVYEFQKDSFLQALRAAVDRGVKTEIIYDAIVSFVTDSHHNKKEAGPRIKNEAAIKDHGLQAVCHPRTGITAISHNKFIVLCKNGKPAAVWTGSTNFTDGAIYGQANVGHAIADEALAQQYFDLHQKLLSKLDADTRTSRQNAEALSPVPPTAKRDPILFPVFSPRTKIIAIDQCVELINGAQQLLCLTAPFPLHKSLDTALEDSDHPCLKYALLNSDNNLVQLVKQMPANLKFAAPASFKRTQGKARIEATEDAGGEHDKLHDFQTRMLTEGVDDLSLLDGFKNESLHHKGVYIHTKILLIDPLSDDPRIVTGSANFSDNSSRNNDENQLFIHGEKAVADVYLGEFMRLYDHYEFRDLMSKAKGEGQQPHLSADDSWTNAYFDGPKEKERQVFSL
jgi:phosphatidylserine/phosphatidylglycerophosphate/cardiolipin synthase-like enzyme